MLTEARERTLREVEQFLYREARLLDEREWDAWLALWESDARYVVPTRHVPLPSKDQVDRPVAVEFSAGEELYFIDEGRASLMLRVMKLRTGKAWSEDPPSRTTRVVSNVEVDERSDRELGVRSNFILYRTRNDADTVLFVGTRLDTLRRREEELRISRREVRLNTGVLAAPSLALFF